MKRNLPLVIAFGLPTLLILAVIAAIYFPRMFVKPQYDFIYVVGQDSYYGPTFRVEQGKVYRVEAKSTSNYYRQPTEPTLYYYDVGEGRTRQISLSEAQKFTLNPSLIAPDGFSLEYGRSDDGLLGLFFGSSRDYNKRYLVRDNVSHKVDLSSVGSSYYYQYQFLGWVIP